MGNFLTPTVALANKFLNIFSDFTYIAYGILWLVFLTVLGLFLSNTYKKIRRKFPVKVNCWFCNNNTNVSYELFNGWECPHCNQYNGFNKDGDYNKIIPEQYNYKLNKGILKSSVGTKKTTSQTNGFCKLCNINQQLKIQQLALFVPLNENNYYAEIEQYREKLEKAYRLCSECEKTLEKTLKKQEYKLLQDRLNYHKYSTSIKSLKNLRKFGEDDLVALFKKYGVLGLKIIQVIVALVLFLALLLQYETENQFLKLALLQFEILEPLLPYLKVLLRCQERLYSFKKELSFVGLVCCFLTYFEFLINKNHFILLVWGVLHISLWSFYTGLHLVISGLCLFFNIQAVRYKFIKLRKKPLPKKSSFQAVQKVFSEFHNHQTSLEGTKPFNKVSSPLLKSDNFSSMEDLNLLDNNKIKETKRKSSKMSESEQKKTKLRQKEEEIESLPSDESKASSLAFVNKSFASSLEADKNDEESTVPFTEVYNNLSSLQLGTKQEKPNKPPNFLFASHNFSGNKTTSVIKPAKFIKNLNSSSWTESNECNSRSSTPSSGYSSQKPEKVEPNRYDFSKPISPFPVNSFIRHSPNHCFDYYDGNHGFYNAVNCFSPGFVPFQQFPGAMGHTTIYTCTRPTNFPFPFSPWQGVPPQKLSPSRFSEASDCDNLFKESCKKYEKNKKWFKLNTILYYFSIFFNFVTIMGIIYFTSAGIILVDWKIPKFNFFM